MYDTPDVESYLQSEMEGPRKNVAVTRECWCKFELTAEL